MYDVFRLSPFMFNYEIKLILGRNRADAFLELQPIPVSVAKPPDFITTTKFQFFNGIAVSVAICIL